MARADALAVGRVQRGQRQELLYHLPMSTLLRHALVTGTTGWGKSGHFLSVILGVLTHHPEIGIVLVDLKGETAAELRDRFLPALAAVNPRIRPENVISIAPFGRFGVPLNPLRPILGLAPEVQANLVCSLVGSLVDGGLGPRMTGVLAWLAQATIAIEGSFLDILQMLTDETYREAVAQKMHNPAIRDYLIFTFDQEPRASCESLRARLEWLLLLPAMRGMLCAKDCIRGSDLIESPITIVDLGGAPQGFAPLSRFVGSFLFQLLTGAVFSRPVTPDTKPALLFVDEWQSLVKASGEDFERLLSQARYRKVGLWLANQTLAQVDGASGGLLRSLTTNIALHVAFRPEMADIKHLLPLLPVTGRRVDPDQPDRLLTKDEERRRLLETLTRLPPRHALLGDLVSGNAEVIRTLGVPYEQARKRAEALPEEQVERFRQGRFGIPIEQLATTALAVDYEPTDNEPRGLRTAQSRRGRQPPLELP